MKQVKKKDIRAALSDIKLALRSMDIVWYGVVAVYENGAIHSYLDAAGGTPRDLDWFGPDRNGSELLVEIGVGEGREDRTITISHEMERIEEKIDIYSLYPSSLSNK